MAFKYMKRWSPSLLRKMQWKLPFLNYQMDQNPQLWKQSAGATRKQASQIASCHQPLWRTIQKEVSLKTTKHSPPGPPITETVSTYWSHPRISTCQGHLPSTSTRIKLRAAAAAEWIKRTYSVTVGWFHNRQRKTMQL